MTDFQQGAQRTCKSVQVRCLPPCHAPAHCCCRCPGDLPGVLVSRSLPHVHLELGPCSRLSLPRPHLPALLSLSVLPTLWLCSTEASDLRAQPRASQAGSSPGCSHHPDHSLFSQLPHSTCLFPTCLLGIMVGDFPTPGLGPLRASLLRKWLTLLTSPLLHLCPDDRMVRPPFRSQAQVSRLLR